MGLSTTTTIFLFIVCLCGGIIIGAMFGRMRKAPPDRPEEAPKPDSTAKSLARPGETEILRAWRDEQEKIWLEMDGQRLENKEALEAGQKAKLLEMVRELRPWLEAAPTPAPRPQVQEAPSPIELAPRPSPAAPRPPAAEKKADEEKPQVNLKSIVEQIDDVLQEKLAGTVFDSQKIHLLEGRAGEVQVQIGAQKYSGVEAVPNPEVQALIRQAVADWEKKSG
ncbi:MAG: hypothetical protein AB1531_00270 [Chloroflexota bacterium]